jgi:hypothetical protein
MAGVTPGNFSRVICRTFVVLASVPCLLALAARAQVPISITVDTTSHGYAIPPDFSGLSFERGTENSGNAGVSGYFFSPSNTQLITLFQNIGLRSLRVGGGSVDDEPLVTNTANDNLFQFAAAAGTKVIYTVRMLNTHNSFPDLKDQDAAIDGYIWQNYRGLVSNFAIGNEPDWHNPYHTAGDPAIYETTPGVAGTAYPSYLADWRAFAATILAATPGAKFSGPDTGAYTTFTYSNGESWTQRFAQDEASSGLIADITQHYYVGGSPSTTAATQAIDNMLSPAWLNDAAIGTQPTGAGDGKTTTYSPYPWLYTNNLAPVVALNLPYRLTEFNDYLTGINGASNGYAAALWALDAMRWWAEHGAAGVNFHNKQWIYTDTIVPDPNPCSMACGDFQTTPKGYGIKAFNMGSHGYVEPVTLNNPGNMNLTAYAVGDARDLYVTVVNKTHDSTGDATDATVSISPTGYGPASCAAMTLTDGQDGNAALMTASLGGAAIANDSRWQGEWTPVSTDRNGHCSVTVQAASAVVVKLRAAGNYAGPMQMNQNGALEIFGTDGSGNVLHDWQIPSTIPQSDLSGWNGWANDLGGVAAGGSAAVARNADNTLQIFVPAKSGDVFTNYQTAPGGPWNGWTDMGSTSSGVTDLAAANNADGSLTVCGVGSNGDLWCSSENAPGVGWSAWNDLSGAQIRPGFAIGQNLNGRLEIFGVAKNFRAMTNMQTDSGGWAGWTLLTSSADASAPRASGAEHLLPNLAVARNVDGRLEVFGIGAGGLVWHIAQQSPDGPWGNWSLINIRLRPGFIVGQNSDGRLQIFGFPPGRPVSGVWTISQSSPGGAAWGRSSDLGASLQHSQLVAGNTADGRIQIFGVGSNGDVWSTWQTSGGDCWSKWTDFGGNGVNF